VIVTHPSAAAPHDLLKLTPDAGQRVMSTVAG
jgi:hypothetical protein